MDTVINNKDLFPMFLKPVLKDFVWGGTRITEEYGYPSDLSKVAEAWVLSCHPQGASVVINGPFAGKTLTQVLEILGPSVMGKGKEGFTEFPLLIKLIDAREKLSVQVHPTDDYALRVEGEQGKTEMWHVIDCEPGAQLLYGVNRPLTKEEFKQHITDNTLDEVSNYVTVNKGDTFFIPAGTLHAIGAGILLAEVQQNSAITYRVSDYGRMGADGKPRPLHIEKALDVTDLKPTSLQPAGVNGIKNESGEITTLIECDYFTAQTWQLSGSCSVGREDTFLSLVCLSGDGVLTVGKTEYPVKKGDSIFFPAGLSGTLSGELTMLCSYV